MIAIANILNKIVSLAIIIITTYCRISQISFLYNQFSIKQGVIYLDKMVFQPGMSKIQIETRSIGMSLGGLSQNTNIIFQVVPEQNWSQVQKQKCNARETGLRTSHKLSPPLTQNPQKWTDKSNLMMHVEEQKIYYFILKDCGKSLHGDYNNNQLTLYVRLNLINNGKQMGQEQDHWYIIPIIITAGMWLILFNKQALQYNGQPDWAKRLLFMGIGANISSLTWRTFGYIIYSVSGFDYIFFHIVYLFMHAVSESFVIGLLVLIAFGWSINYSKGKDMDLYLPLMSLVALLNILLTVLTKINHRSHDRHHIFDSIPGMLLIYYRLIILCIFIGGVFYTYKSSRHRVKQFIIKFASFGFLYLAALPIILFWANTNVQPKDRNEFVFVMVQSIKTLCNIVLTYIISSKRSQYQNVTFKNNSFIPQENQGFR